MDILNLIKSIVNKTGTGAKDFATGYMSLSDKAEQMQKKGTMANLGHLTANALPPQSGVGGVDDIIRGIAPIGALMMGGLKETGVASKALNMLKPFTASTKGDPQFAADLLRDSAASIATKALKDPSSA